MTSHPLGIVFEAMMEKGQDQIPEYFYPNPNLNNNPNPNLNLSPKLNPNLNPNPNPNLNPNPKPNPFVVISAW